MDQGADERGRGEGGLRVRGGLQAAGGGLTPAPDSALLIAVPEAEPLVASDRLAHDPSAPLGVPAHITLLYPFLAPDRVDDSVLSSLAAVFAAEPSFQFALTELRWFAGEVLYVAPEPSEPFRRLSRRLSAEFGLAPYGGQFVEVVPHLTVAQGAAAATGQDIAARLRGRLPIRCRATQARWMVGMGDAFWRTRATFRLG